MAPPREIEIHGDTIRLGQLLKLAGVIGSGAEVKALLATETVLVNGEPDGRRGRQLHPGDVITVADELLEITGAGAGAGDGGGAGGGGAGEGDGAAG